MSTLRAPEASRRYTPPRRNRLVAGVILSAALAAAACGTGESMTGSSGTTMGTTATTAMGTMPGMDHSSGSMKPTADGVDSEASKLRATLTDQLTGHVYLAGIAVSMGVGNGLDSPQFKAAADTLDKNSVALSESVASVYGKPAGDQFLALWRKHIGMFVDYTKGKATGDAALAAKAQADLAQYGNDFGAFLESANPNLPKAAVAEELKPHVATLTAAIDKVVAKDPGAFAALRTAAEHMPHTAEVLAGGIAKQKNLGGDVMGKPAALRSGLTYLLDEHVYLAGIAVVNGVGNGLDSAEFKAAADTLDLNSVKLSEAIASVYGKPAGDQFLALWRKHIGMFVDYTKGKATGDRAVSDKALKDLEQYAQDFGAFLESANPNLPKAAVAEELKPHVATLTAAIDKVVAKDAGAFDALATAAGHMPHTAQVLSDGIVKQGK